MGWFERIIGWNFGNKNGWIIGNNSPGPREGRGERRKVEWNGREGGRYGMGVVEGGVECGRGLGPREGRGSAWEVERVEGGEEQCGRCNKMEERKGVWGEEDDGRLEEESYIPGSLHRVLLSDTRDRWTHLRPAQDGRGVLDHPTTDTQQCTHLSCGELTYPAGVHKNSQWTRPS